MGHEKQKTEESFYNRQAIRYENRKEMLIKYGHLPFIMEWERPYMEACIDILEPSGDILEIGFGCGYSSTHIQSYLPKSHTIIEDHPGIFEKAKEWAAGYSNVNLIQDKWQRAFESLGVFDRIFFDGYPIKSGIGLTENFWSLIENKDSTFHEKIALISTGKCSDEEVDHFFEELPTVEAIPIEYLFSFFSELRENNHINRIQQEYLFEKLKKKRKIKKGTIQAFFKQHIECRQDEKESGAQLSKFFNICAETHMRKGSCFACFITDSISQFQKSEFFKMINKNPHFEYEEKLISMPGSENDGYAHKNQSFVIIITKK